MSPQAERRRLVTLERSYRATADEVWDMWTTKDGIESWWGPDGFTVTVHVLDLRPGGELRYVMTAVGPDQIRFMDQAGMPREQPCLVTYTEVVGGRRLGYVHRADFVPGVEPYDVAHTVEIEPQETGVLLRLSFEAMHDERWTGMATMGWESELAKLERVLAA